MDHPDWGYSALSNDDDSSPFEKRARYFELGKAFAEKAKTVEAIALLSEYLEEIDFVEDPDLLVIAAESALDVLCTQGRFDDANSLLALALSKLEPWANFHLGYLYRYRVSVLRRQQRFSEAIEDCRTSIALFESDEQIEWSFPLRNQCGEMLFKQDCFMEATKVVAPAISGKSLENQIVVRGIALSISGKSEFEMGNFDGAIALLRDSLAILKPLENGELGACTSFLAKALMAKGRDSEARGLLEKVLKEDIAASAKVDLQSQLDYLVTRELSGFPDLSAPHPKAA